MGDGDLEVRGVHRLDAHGRRELLPELPGPLARLLEVVDTPNVLFGSEMVGAVRGIDERTGHHYDDTRRYIEASALDDEARAAVFEHNVRRVYPRLAAALR